jgi:hypothetical protein
LDQRGELGPNQFNVIVDRHSAVVVLDDTTVPTPFRRRCACADV